MQTHLFPLRAFKSPPMPPQKKPLTQSNPLHLLIQDGKRREMLLTVLVKMLNKEALM